MKLTSGKNRACSNAMLGAEPKDMAYINLATRVRFVNNLVKTPFPI